MSERETKKRRKTIFFVSVLRSSASLFFRHRPAEPRGAGQRAIRPGKTVLAFPLGAVVHSSYATFLLSHATFLVALPASLAEPERRCLHWCLSVSDELSDSVAFCCLVRCLRIFSAMGRSLTTIPQARCTSCPARLDVLRFFRG